MPERTSHSATWLSFLLLFLLVCHAQTASISGSAHTPSTSASDASASANQRTTRSVELATEEDKDGCSSDFVEKFFRLLSGPVGKEGEALVAAVLKILSENDRVNWPAMADWFPVSAISPSSSSSSSSRTLPAVASKLRGMFLDGVRRIRGHEKRLAPKFNPTGWRRKRSVDSMAESLDTLSLLRGLLAKYEESELLGDEFAPKMPEVSDDVKLAPESPEWPETGKRSLLSRRVNRRRLSERLPKRKPLEFNPTGW